MVDYEKYAVVWMINTSQVQKIRNGDPDTNFYGGSIIFDEERTKQALVDLNTHGIDWDATSTIKEDSLSVFQGTEADSREEKYLYCQVVGNSGKIYRFARNFCLDDLARIANAMNECRNDPMIKVKYG